MRASLRRRVWSEEVPFEVVGSRRVLALCRAHGLELLVAVRPAGAAGLGDLLAACAGAGVRAGIWPMLDDADGRWVSARNAGAFSDFTRRTVDALGARGLAPSEVAIDLEPPIDEVRRLLAGARLRIPRLGDLAGARRTLESLVGDLAARGIPTSAAVVPLVLGGAGWERILDTPVSGLALESVSVMLYTSILEGWSRGALRRADAVALLAAGARAAREKLGARAGVSLGAVGVGAFGSEPTYRSPAELASDVAATRAAGVDDLTLLDLGGVLARAPVEAWLEAFVETEPAAGIAPAPRRVRAALLAIGALGALAGLMTRPARL